MSKRSAGRELTKDNWEEEDPVEEAGTWKPATADELAKRPIRKAVRRGTVHTEDKPAIFANFTGFGNSAPSSTPMFSFGNKTSPTKPSFNFGATGSPTTKPMFSFGNNNSETKTNDKPAVGMFNFGSPKPADTGSKESVPFSFGKIDSQTKSSLPSPKSDSNKDSNNDKPTLMFSPSNASTVATNKTNGVSPSKDSNKVDESKEKYFAELKSLNTNVKDWIIQCVEKNPLINLEPVFNDYNKHFKEVQKKYEQKSEPEKTTTAPTFSFNQNKSPSKDDSSSQTKSSLNFSFGSDKSSFKPFSFGNLDSSKTGGSVFGGSTGFSFNKPSESTEKKEEKEKETAEGEPTDEPPKVEVEVKEEGSFYEKKCKLFYKKDKNYVDKGVGMLFMKKSDEKTQMIIRNVTKLGTILLNIVISSSMPCQKMGKKDVLIVCVPNPPIDDVTGPTSMLIRVKSPEDADELLEKIKENKPEQ